MVQSCVAYNCTERFEKGSDISFHSFPNDITLKNQWILAIRRKNFKPTKHSRICSKHFTLDSFNSSPWSSKKSLKIDAVPSIFDFPNHLIKKTDTRKPPPLRVRSQNVTVENKGTIEKETTENGETSTVEPLIKKRRVVYVGDYKENNLPIDQKYHFAVKQALLKNKKKIKLLQQKNRRLVKKVSTLKSLLEHLKQQRMVDEDCFLKLSYTMPVSAETIFKQLLKSKQFKTYPPELKSFALTLNFYSPKAYSYVRTTFPDMLPHPRTLQKWYQAVECGSGFQTECIKVLQQKVLELREKGKACICSLIIDEMAIHKKIEWDGEKFVGYVDIGSELHNDSLPEASEAIVFLINSVNDRWKAPVGYFLTNGLTGIQKKNLLTICLKILHEIEITICSLTFDGAASNVSMLNLLGVDFTVNSSKSYFLHPDTKQPIYIMLDPPHMLKLMRNTLGTYKIIYDDNFNCIKWEYLQKLVDIQELEGLHLATKITRRHINWFKEKMKVKLAAQTFSLSVAKALKYLRETGYSKEFKSSMATEKFVSLINDVFDILNSRNLLAKHFKASLQQHNKVNIFEKINEAIEYLKSLKCPNNGEPLHLSQRKTGVIGLIISLNSYMGIWKHYVENTDSGLRYLSAYKLCQDHLEVFFSAIRSHGGYNNNPTTKQFQAAYKRLLMHISIKGSMQGNCIEQEPTILLATSTHIKTNKYCDTENDLVIKDHDYTLNGVSFSKRLSLYVHDIVEYIAGFVVKQIKKKIVCEICLSAIECKELQSSLIKIKNYSDQVKALIQPSKDVIHICKVAESQIRLLEKTNKLHTKNLMGLLIINIISNIPGSIFDAYKEHMFDHDIESNHIAILIKLISVNYCNIRLYHKGECFNKHFNRIRSNLTKTILFSNQ